jgi:Fatty acid hydroxylase superfamily
MTGNPHFVSARDESVRMFRHDWLERMTRVHPAIPHLIYLPVIAGLLWWAPTPPFTDVWLAGAGLLLWSAVEYVMHRHLFHAPDAVMSETHDIVAQLRPGEAVVPRLPGWRHVVYFIMHGVHHEYPSDSSRLVVPPGASVPLAVLFALSFRGVLGPHLWAPVFVGFLGGYLVYDTVHYAVHHRRMRTAIGRYTKWRHYRHHFTDPDRDYGVTSPLWDLVMGTRSRRSESTDAAASP